MLLTHCTFRQDPNEKIVGGYILYGPEYTRFISVADVIIINGDNDGQSDKVDKIISGDIASSPAYFLTNMLTEKLL